MKVQCSPKRFLVLRVQSLLLTLSYLSLTGCQGMPGQAGQNANSSPNYASVCAGGAALGAGGSAIFDILKSGSQKKSSSPSLSNNSLKRAGMIGAAGCAVGLAATAIGQVLNDQEKRKADEAFQKAAKEGAAQSERERQQIEDRYKTMPQPTTDAEKANREQDKKREVANANSKDQPAQGWSEGATAGKAIYIGTVPTEASKGGGSSNCARIREVVLKDGKEVTQISTACMSENGEYQRVEVKPA